MKKALFLLGFGLLPVWATSLYAWRGSIGARSDYWTAAPWLIFFSIPVCAITLGIAVGTLIVYQRTQGEPSEKFRAGARTFGMLVSISALLAGGWYLTLMKRQANNEALKQRAIALVRSHPAVLQEFGADFQTGLASMTTGSNERPKRMEIRVSSGAKRLYAIVDVSDDDLRFACLTAVDMGRRNSGQHPCQQ
jgi:hypothetical protein